MQDKIIINDHVENDSLYGENLDNVYEEREKSYYGNVNNKYI